MVFVSICTPSCRMIKEALLIWRWAKWKVRTNMVDFQLTMLSCDGFFVFFVAFHVDFCLHTSIASTKYFMAKSSMPLVVKIALTPVSKILWIFSWKASLFRHVIWCGTLDAFEKIAPRRMFETSTPAIFGGRGYSRCLNSLNRLDPSD